MGSGFDFARGRAVWIALAFIVAGIAVTEISNSSTAGRSSNVAREAAASAQASARTAHRVAGYARASCIGGSFRTVQQLQWDWDVYEADRARARTQTGVQKHISDTEAHRTLTQMKKIAAVRIRYLDAPFLPGQLARIIVAKHFTCPSG